MTCFSCFKMSDYNPKQLYEVLYLGKNIDFFMNGRVSTHRLIGRENVEKGLENRLVIRAPDPEKHYPPLPDDFAEYFGLRPEKNIQENDPLVFYGSLRDIDAVVIDFESPVINEDIKEKLEFDFGYRGKIHVTDYEHGITIKKVKKQIDRDAIQP